MPRIPFPTSTAWRFCRRSAASWLLAGLFLGLSSGLVRGQDDLTPQQWDLVRHWQQQRIEAIHAVIGSVVAIYDDDRQGGGSGVVIAPNGLALTNHHVIMGAGVRGWGGMADGQLYRWELIGTDPGGDVALIQMLGRDDFPYTPLGDSDDVRVGDWALAMGNPFILTEDQSPTVTLGIVSGIQRYQAGAGQNQLVYGNCIQVDSSINPGNSGGPLFNFHHRVIGINGRASFEERGRVNVGLGYAISANQVKNFLPELMATKLVEHATLDANFEDRQAGVVCARRNVDSPIAQAGLELGDILLEFDGVPIDSANHYTNLICTLPAGWPMELVIQKPTGEQVTLHVRSMGLPYARPPRPRGQPKPDAPPQEKRKFQRQMEMVELLSAPAGQLRVRQTNRGYAEQLMAHWQSQMEPDSDQVQADTVLEVSGPVLRKGQAVGSQTTWVRGDGRLRVQWQVDDQTQELLYDGQQVFDLSAQPAAVLPRREVLKHPALLQGLGLLWALAPAKLQGGLGPALIDGSDKARRQRAFRMQLTDDQGDSSYAWFASQAEVGIPDGQLVKLAADPDAKQGGVALDDWTAEGPVWIPHRRSIIQGLAENEVWQVGTARIAWDTVEPDWFQVPAAGTESGEPPQ